MTKKLCRWGFLGAAKIARKNWKAVRYSGNGVVTAVASRDAARAEAFIHDCSLESPPVMESDGEMMLARPDAMGRYEDLLGRDDIDAVYIALPTGIRKEWVLRAIAAGKHVLIEKPVAVHGDDAAEMVAAAAAANLNFMDGVMFDHSSRLPELQHTLADPVHFGTLRRVQTHFSFLGDDSFETANIRADAHLEPHGCLGDLGWYCIRFTLWANGDRLPTAVSGRTLVALDEGRVPGEFQGEMQFADGVSAGLFCSFACVNQQTATLTGDRGYVTIDDFVLPFVDAESKWQRHNHDLKINNCRWDFGRHTTSLAVRESASGQPDSQEVRMFRHFAAAVLHGKPATRAADIAVKTQRVLDALRRSAVEDGRWTIVS